MDLTKLMNSLSINNKETSASNFRTFAAEINNIYTDIVLGDFSDKQLLIVTQYEKVGSVLRVTKDQVVDNLNHSEPVFSVHLVFGVENIEQQAAARYIAEKLNISKPLMAFINLKNYERDTVHTIATILCEVASKNN